jgi:type IV secretory pathway TrbF-like protein
MTTRGSSSSVAPASHADRAEIDAEREGWYEFVRLVRSLTPEECREPGYYRDPVWTVRDVVAHLGTWLAETQVEHGA